MTVLKINLILSISDGIFKAAMTAGGGTTSFISMISVTMTSGLILMIFK